MNRRCRFVRQLRMLLQDRRGGPAMEFAVISPILVVCTIFAYDLGNALQQRIRLAEAVRAGGLYALYYPTQSDLSVNSTAIAAAVTNAVPEWTDVSVSTPVMACYCWDRTTSTFGSAVTCSTADSTTCGSTGELRRYITISASRPFRPVLMTNLSSVSYSHVVRYQ